MNLNRLSPEHIARALSWRARYWTHAALVAMGRKVLPRLGPTIAFMARTGAGTDECLAHGALPMPVHFYSAVPDIADLRVRDVWARRSRMEGVNFQPGRQLAF